MPYNALGTYSPIPLEPYAAQTQIYSQIAKDNPQVVPALLTNLAQQHAVGEQTYTGQIEGQRQIAAANIHQQMVDNAIKAMDVTSKLPGGFDFFSQAHPELLGQASPQAQQAFSDALALKNRQDQFKTVAGGLYEAAQGGYGMNIPDASRLAGAPLVAQTPIGISEAQINAAGRAASQRQPMTTIKAYIGEMDPDGFTPIQSNVAVPLFASPQEQQAYIEAARQAQRQALVTAPGRTRIPDQRQPQGPGTAPGGTPGPKITLSPDGSGAPQTSDTSGVGALTGGLTPQDYTNAGLPPPTSTSVPPVTRPPPPGTTYAQPDTPPATSGGAQAAPAQTGGSAGSPGASTKLPDTPVGQTEPPTGKQGISLQQRAQRGLSTVPQADRADIMDYASRKQQIPIRIIGGIPMYINPKTGVSIGPVP